MSEPEVIASVQLSPEAYDYLFAIGDGDPAAGVDILISEREKVFGVMEKVNLGKLAGIARAGLLFRKKFF